MWRGSAALLGLISVVVGAQSPRPLIPIEFVNSAEYGWLQKPVLASRVLDDMTQPATWRFTGTGKIDFPATPRFGDRRVLRVDMDMFRDKPAPTRNGLSSVNLQRSFGGEDWRSFNRLSMWIRPDVAGFPMLPLQIVLHNDGATKVPDAYYREGIHYVTLTNGAWQHVVWEIEPLARDRVTTLEIGYWVNKMLAAPGDRVAFEIAQLELQRVDPDHHTGWNVAPGRIAFSHSGYQSGLSKNAIASNLSASEFEVVRVDGNALGEVVLRRAVDPVKSRLGAFQRLDFSSVNAPGRYILRADNQTTRPFQIDPNVWSGTIWKVLNFFYAERCGFDVPGSHGVDHLDWFATHGDQRIVMSGGWHDAGDLSQGLINTGEATYAMFALAERIRARGDDPALVARLLEEAKWGLDWVMRVRFDGGYRMAFASHNLWTNNIVGDADDRLREAKNNPNANYIAAAAEAMAYRVLKAREPELAARALRIAEDDWQHAIVGVEGPSTWHTPAFAATPLELAGIGVTASVELYRATGKRLYADKAFELARAIVTSQERRFVGKDFPLTGFFYTGPDRSVPFHQFHRGNDQAPVVALTQLVESFPDHADWMSWYSTLALYAEYQKKSASTTSPYGVLPAYVYRLGDEVKEVPDSGALHMATRASYRAQVQAGLPMGDGVVSAIVPGLVRASRELRRTPIAGQGIVRRGTITRRQRGARSCPRAGSVDRWTQSVRAEHDVRRGIRLGAAIQRIVGRLRWRAPSRNAESRRDRPSVLAVAEHVRLQGSMGTLGEPLAVAHGRSRRRGDNRTHDRAGRSGHRDHGGQWRDLDSTDGARIGRAHARPPNGKSHPARAGVAVGASAG